MKNSVFAFVLTAIAVVALIAGAIGIDHAHAAIGLGTASVAMAGMVTIKAPVTTFHKGQFVAPGTEIELDEVEARRITAAHGSFGGPGDPDPGNTQMRNVDIASINALNEQVGIHKGTGPDGSQPIKNDTVLTRDALDKLNREKLVAMAAELKVLHAPEATKAQIIDAMLLEQAKA